MRRERTTNPKCLGITGPDTFGTRSADFTGPFFDANNSRRIIRRREQAGLAEYRAPTGDRARSEVAGRLGVPPALGSPVAA